MFITRVVSFKKCNKRNYCKGSNLKTHENRRSIL